MGLFWILMDKNIFIWCKLCKTGLTPVHEFKWQRRCLEMSFTVKIQMLHKYDNCLSLMCVRLLYYQYSIGFSVQLPITNAWHWHWLCAALSSNVGASVGYVSLLTLSLGTILLFTCFVKFLRNTHWTHTESDWSVYWLAFCSICKFHWFWYLFRYRHMQILACSLKRSILLFGKWVLIVNLIIICNIQQFSKSISF